MAPEELLALVDRNVLLEFTDGEVIEARLSSVDADVETDHVFLCVGGVRQQASARTTAVGEYLACSAQDLHAAKPLC